MRIAMWSGPRNLSTAMMYSFGSRTDCSVVDEPFYGAYLAMTGLDHPMRSEIIETCETDPQRVIEGLIGSNKGNLPHFYQKHMTQHMIAGIDRGWMKQVKNVFLIRHPARVIASYVKKREMPLLADLGLQEQMELYDLAVSFGQVPPVIDSVDVRKNPKRALTALCDAIGIPFDARMLSWPAGGHKDDGIWAQHWYGAVHESTGFAGTEGPLPELPDQYLPLLQQALPYYQAMASKRVIKA